MATPVLIPVSEYLNTTCHPDCDYVDGELKERMRERNRTVFYREYSSVSS
jgi:hypothetical protein